MIYEKLKEMLREAGPLIYRATVPWSNFEQIFMTKLWLVFLLVGVVNMVGVYVCVCVCVVYMWCVYVISCVMCDVV